jgi:hypothetical protein
VPPGPGCNTKPGKTIIRLDVPYVHQVNDVDGADGNWACGPTSVLMVLAYYGKLEPWPRYEAEQAGRPSESGASTQDMKSNFAPYLTTAYTNNGHTYSATAPDPRGNRVAGLYGTIAPTGLADWGRIKQVLGWHGLQTQYVTPTWNGVVAALKRGHPVLLGNDLTPAGHVMVAIGYTANNQLIINDPYGNRFTAGYGANNGQGVYYPWNCSRVHNALDVIGVYPPPVPPTSTPTITPEVPTPAPIVNAPPPPTTPDGSEVATIVTPAPKADVVMFAVQAIARDNLRDNLLKNDLSYADRFAAQRQPVGQDPHPVDRVLIAHRTYATPAYWWLTAPTLLALAGFVVTLADRRRKRTADTPL